MTAFDHMTDFAKAVWGVIFILALSAAGLAMVADFFGVLYVGS